MKGSLPTSLSEHSLATYSGGPAPREQEESGFEQSFTDPLDREPLPSVEVTEVSVRTLMAKEITDLKERICEQEEALRQSAAAAHDIEEELRESRAETARARSHLMALSKKGSGTAAIESELSFLKTQYVRAQSELQREHRRRQTEVAFAEQKALALEKQLLANRKPPENKKKKVLRRPAWIAIGVSLALRNSEDTCANGFRTRMTKRASGKRLDR